MPDDMFHDSAEVGDPLQRRVGRRQLIRASAWATPVIVLATAAPAAAASSGRPVTAIGAKALVFDNFTVDGVGDCSHATPPVSGISGHLQQIAGRFGLRYDYSAWEAMWDEPAPDSISVTYALKIDDTTLLGPTDVVIPKYASTDALHWHLSALSAGVHRVAFAAISRSQTIHGRTYTIPALVTDVSITVLV